jgi:hypothetical protein
LRSTCPSQASKTAMPERSCGDEMKPQSATVKVKTMRCRSQKLGLNIYRSFARHCLHIWRACNERFLQDAKASSH